MTFDIVGQPLAFGMKTNVDSETYLTDVYYTNENSPEPSTTASNDMTFDLVQVPSTNLSVKWVDVNRQQLARENTPATVLKDILTFNFIENRKFDLPNQDRDELYFRLINKVKRVEVKDMQGATALVSGKKDGEEVTLDGKIYKLTTSYDPAFNKGSKIQLMYMPDVIDRTKNPESPTPTNYVRVTIDAGEGTELAQGETKKVYDVRLGKALKAEHYPKLELLPGHKDPITWTIAPGTAINKAENILGKADKTSAEKITAANLKAVDTTALQGQELDEKFWHEGVALADAVKDNEDFKALLKDAKVTDLSSRTSAKVEDQVGKLLVTFKDGSTLEVEKQKLIVKPNTVKVSFDNEANDDAKAPRHLETVVKGKVSSTENYPVKGSLVEILDKENKVIGTTKVTEDDGSFVAGTRPLKAGETIKVRVTLPTSTKASNAVEKVVKLNPDRLNALLPIAKKQYEHFKAKENAFIQEKLNTLNTAIEAAKPLVDDNGKAVGADTEGNQTAIDTAVTNLENALKALTANIPPTISGPKTHEIFVGEALDLEKLVDVTDGDGADDLVAENGSNVKITAEKVEGQAQTPVADLSKINETVGTYKITYTAKDKSKAEVTHVMDLTVKPRTNSAIEVTSDPTTMKYLITEKDGKAKLNLAGMTLNLVDNLGKKTKVELTDKNVTFKVNGKAIKDGGDLTLADDVQFIEVEYKDGDNTLTAKTDGVLRVGPDYDKDGKDDRTQNFDPEKIIKLEVIKQPQLDYIAKDKSEDSKFKLNLEGMIIRMTDKTGKEKLAIVKNDGKFYDYDEQTKEITQLTATPAHGATLTPETSATETGDNGKTVKITGPNNSEALTEPLKVFYDANKDGKPDHGKDQKTPAPSAMARNIGKDAKVTTVEGMATPGAVIKITDAQGKVLTTEPEKVIAGTDGKYTATVKPILADGTEIKVTAKLGEMEESDKTPTKVFDDKNDNKQPDKDEGFNIAKATNIKFVDDPDLTYLVKTKDTEVTFNGKDGKGKAIYLELSYKNGEKTESKIMTLEELMKDTKNIAVTPAKGTTDKKENQTHELVGKAIEVKLKNVVEKQGATEDQKTAATATSTSKFAIEIDADGNKKADKDEQTEMPAIISARNVKNATQQDKIETKVKVKALVGSTITIKDENGKVISDAVVVPAKGNDKYNEVEITLKEKQDAGKKVQAIAKLGEKQPSEPAESIVFQDLDGDNKPDGQGELDIANIVEFKLASNPDKMKYPLKSTDAQETLDLTGLMVYLKDKNGNTGIYEYNKKQESPFEELKGNDKFKLELVKDQTTKAIDENTKLSTADDLSKVKATLQIPNSTGQGKVDGKSVETSQLEVFLDANGDGERDTNQTPAPKDLKALNKGNDAFTTITGKAQAGDVIKVYDEDGKEITTDPVTVTAGNDGTFTIKVSKDSKALPKDSLVFVTAQADKKDESPRTPVVVKVDADGSGTADSDETTTITSVIARNIGTGEPKQKATFTTIEGVAEKGSKVTITFTEKGKQKATTKTVDADANTGKYKLELKADPNVQGSKDILLPVDTKVEAKAKYGEKKDSPTIETKVFDDLNADGKDDKAAEQKSKMPQNVRAMNQNKVGQDGKVTNEAKDTTTVKGKVTPGAIVKITSEDGKTDLTPVGGITVDQDGNFTAEITKQDPKKIIKVTATEPGKLESDAAEATVFRDADNNEADDSKATTERPSALAYNFKDEAKTTIKGEAEPGATVVAKVDGTEVGRATANAEGKYTIEATKENAKLPKGTKVSVTATLGPKGESPAQETVVYDDLDGDGQPDTSQAFDKTKIRGFEVVASPNKMVYNNKEKLDLTGMKVKLTDQMGNMKIVEFSEFVKYGITVSPVNNIELSDKEVADGGNNGQKIKAEVKVTIDNNQVTYPGETPTALTVNKDQSAKPTDVTAANQGDDNFTKVRFKAADGAEIKIYKADDTSKTNLIKGTPAQGTGDDAGYLIATLNAKLAEGTWIEITAKEANKLESVPEQAQVIRDKNSKWEAGTGSTLSTPVIDPIREKDEKVVVEAPTAGDKIQTIEVSDQNGKTVRLTKDPDDKTGKTWKVDGSNDTVKENNEGKLEIPVKDKLPLNDRDQIKVTFKDGENPANEAFDRAFVQKASQTPKVDPVYTGDKFVKIVDPTVADPTAKTIKVKVNDNDSMTVEKQADGSWKVKEDPNKVVTIEDGKIVVPLDPSAKKDEVIQVSTINDSGKASPAAKVTVVDKEKLDPPTINPIKIGDKTVAGTALTNEGKPDQFAASTVDIYKKNDQGGYDLIKEGVGVNSDGTYNYPGTTDFKDGDVIRVVANKPGWTSSAAETTVGVDTTALDKAIQDGKDALDPNKGGINDGTPEDKALEKAIQDAEDLKKRTDPKPPTQKELDDAKDKIEKAIENKKKTDEERQKLKDIIKEAEEETKKDGYKDKPESDKTALEKAIADGKENLANNTKIVESTTTIQEKLDIIRMERIRVGVDSLAVGMKTLEIKTSVPGATVKIKINGVLIDTIETDAYGNFSKGLETALQKKQRIVLEASKLGYNDGIFRDRVQ